MKKYLYLVTFVLKTGHAVPYNPAASGYQEALEKAETATGLKEGVDGTMLQTLIRSEEVHGL